MVADVFFLAFIKRELDHRQKKNKMYTKHKNGNAKPLIIIIA